VALIQEPALLLRALIRNALPSSALHWIRRGRGSGRETQSARYCYAVWLRHLVRMAASGLDAEPATIAELGPGASLGVGLASLLTGADRYVAFDVTRHAVTSESVRVFDDLVGLVSAREPIPTLDEFPEVRPQLASHEFPAGILNASRLSHALAPERIAAIRQRVAADLIPYFTPWDDPAVLEEESVDLVISQAVMEHVGDLDHTYRAIFRWLRPGGVMSHQIDFRSHGTSAAWNGHWRFSERRWRLVRGDAAINRLPISRHVAAIEDAGFQIVTCEPERRSDGLGRDQLDAAWRTLSDEDRHSAGAFVQAIRPMSAVRPK